MPTSSRVSKSELLPLLGQREPAFEERSTISLPEEPPTSSGRSAQRLSVTLLRRPIGVSSIDLVGRPLPPSVVGIGGTACLDESCARQNIHLLLVLSSVIAIGHVVFSCLVPFFPREVHTYCLAAACLSVCLSVRLSSVCPSVTRLQKQS